MTESYESYTCKKCKTPLTWLEVYGLNKCKKCGTNVEISLLKIKKTKGQYE